MYNINYAMESHFQEGEKNNNVHLILFRCLSRNRIYIYIYIYMFQSEREISHFVKCLISSA